MIDKNATLNATSLALVGFYLFFDPTWYLTINLLFFLNVNSLRCLLCRLILLTPALFYSGFVSSLWCRPRSISSSYILFQPCACGRCHRQRACHPRAHLLQIHEDFHKPLPSQPEVSPQRNHRWKNSTNFSYLEPASPTCWFWSSAAQTQWWRCTWGGCVPNLSE